MSRYLNGIILGQLKALSQGVIKSDRVSGMVKEGFSWEVILRRHLVNVAGRITPNDDR